ncbi:MAG: hypothetical protein KGD68_04005 [Candidatus Lokiarchaeota archaeon]|nr:hypothetical protein [Candidatus Lokiarchaeota archaeon]
MRDEMEKRLHRVAIKLENAEILCDFSNICIHAETCPRCNEFFLKCNTFLKLKTKSS